MKKILTYIVILVLTNSIGWAIAAEPTLSRVPRDPQPVDRFAALKTAITKEMADLKIPGAAIAVIEGGEITFAQGFGTKHPDQTEPVETSTLFRIGSVTKILTAIGLLQQVDQGIIDLNAPVTDYLPEFTFKKDPTWASSIKVSDLLTHQSAMADYILLDTPDFVDDQALDRYFTDIYPTSPGAYLMAPAGRMYNYTNPGFMIAGWLTERISNQTYHQYLREHVFTPLGMNRTCFLPEDAYKDGDFAYGSALHWETGEPSIIEPNTYDNAWARPAGYAFSSVLDLAKLIQFLRNGNDQVLSSQLWQAMQTALPNLHVTTTTQKHQASYPTRTPIPIHPTHQVITVHKIFTQEKTGAMSYLKQRYKVKGTSPT